MKTLLLTLAMLVGSSHAHAFLSKGLVENAKASSNLGYNLNEFKVADGSRYLPSGKDIQSAHIQVNRVKNELTLTVFKKFSCPRGRICLQMMPAPTIISLPIVYFGSPFCGGTVIRAERNLLPVDGDFVAIEIVDDNGNRCASNDAAKKANIILTERGARDSHELVSQKLGSPELN